MLWNKPPLQSWYSTWEDTSLCTQVHVHVYGTRIYFVLLWKYTSRKIIHKNAHKGVAKSLRTQSAHPLQQQMFYCLSLSGLTTAYTVLVCTVCTVYSTCMVLDMCKLWWTDTHNLTYSGRIHSMNFEEQCSHDAGRYDIQGGNRQGQTCTYNTIPRKYCGDYYLCYNIYWFCAVPLLREYKTRLTGEVDFIGIVNFCLHEWQKNLGGNGSLLLRIRLRRSTPRTWVGSAISL